MCKLKVTRKNILKAGSFISGLCDRLVMRILSLTLKRFLWITLTGITIGLVFWFSHDDSTDYTNKETLGYPLILWWSSSFPGTSTARTCPKNIKCEVHSNRNLSKKFDVKAFLFYGSDISLDDLPLPRTKDVIWGLYHEESPRNVVELTHEKMLNLFNYTATFSRYSNIPFPLQYLESSKDITSLQYFVPIKEKNRLQKNIAPVLYLQSDCETSSERDAYVTELMKLIRIDSYGACLNNKDLSKNLKDDYLNKLNDDEFLKFIARYKFVIAIENGVCEDYITEKLWRAIKVGTVPIYFGSLSVKDWLPNEKSAVLLQDYPKPDILKEHLEKLLDNDKMYEEYLEHKTKQSINNQRLLKELEIRPYQVGDSLKIIEEFECFVCQKLHERMEGSKVINIANESHYNCPKPISALTLDVNPRNSWIFTWEMAKQNVEALYQRLN